MSATFLRKDIDIKCPKCCEIMKLVRCKQPNRTTYNVACDNYECNDAKQTYWYFTKQEALQAAKDNNWR